ncbi:hypothetical protein QFC22_005661 [Naganishia vaughanmartiniae]|uniref:Uncharacterized protein n=1 Tax=Naganishia vaughanmartiniae TaxID=1424756 RepID=A0ACC2WSR5_9TREE|nr:hypothetical protein QFC22_005661 [Naganishia vaughanmartiniae]
MSKDQITEDSKIWRRVFDLVDTKIECQHANIGLGLENSLSTFEASAPRAGISSMAKRSISAVLTEIRPTSGDFDVAQNTRNRQRHIIAMAEQVLSRVDVSTTTGSSNQMPQKSMLAVTQKYHYRNPGLLEKLSELSNIFSFKEVQIALDNSRSDTRSDNALFSHPAASGEQLERRLNACRVAKHELALGDEANDESIVYLEHGLGHMWTHWMWPTGMFSEHPNIFWQAIE